MRRRLPGSNTVYKQLDTSAHHFSLFIFNVTLHQAEGGGVELIEKNERWKQLREEWKKKKSVSETSSDLHTHFMMADEAHKYRNSSSLISSYYSCRKVPEEPLYHSSRKCCLTHSNSKQHKQSRHLSSCLRLNQVGDEQRMANDLICSDRSPCRRGGGGGGDSAVLEHSNSSWL